MPRDSAGNYTLPAGNPVASGEIISANWANSTMEDIGDSLSSSLDRYGRGGMLAPFQFADGTESAPGATWSNEPSTGFYRNAYADLRLTITGQDNQRWTASSSFLWRNSAWQEIVTIGDNSGTLTVDDLIVNNDLTVDTDTLVVDSTNNRVGIGTANPATRLHIGDGTGGETVTFELDVSSLATFKTSRSSNGFTFNHPSAELMRIDANGNVGIGTASPGGSASSREVTVAGSASAQTSHAAGGAECNVGTNGSLSFVQGVGLFPLTLGTNNVERMRISPTGNVGIGTDNPTERLSIDSTAASTFIKIGNSTDDRVFVGNDAGAAVFLTSSNERMRIDNSGNVGIGTTAPVSYQQGPALNIGDTSDTYAQLNFTTATNGIQYIGFGDSTTGNARYQGLIQFNHNDNSMGFGTGASTVSNLLIDSSGNVGIGTTDPATTLAVAKADRVNGPTVSITNTLNDSSWAPGDVIGRVDFRIDDGSTTEKVRGRIQSVYAEGTGGITYPSASGLSFHVASVNTLSEAMRIDANGRVGIGTTSPAGILTVDVGAADGGPTNQKGIAIRGGASSIYTSWLGNTDDGLEIGPTSGARGVQFWAGGSEAMRLDSSGNLLVGTTSATASFAVSGSAGTKPIAEYLTPTAGVFHRITYATNTSLKHSFTGSGGDYAIVNNTGGVVLGKGATSWVAASDETLKENISDIGPVLDTVKSYRCVNYSLKSTESDAADKVGFIAQDWESDFPNVVSKAEDGTLGMKYTETIPVLLKAIQEQQEMIESLKAEVEALKG